MITTPVAEEVGATTTDTSRQFQIGTADFILKGRVGRKTKRETKTMIDKELRAKLAKYQGWDYCEHNRIRRFCEECKWDVPAYMTQDDPEHCETKVEQK